MVRRCQSSSVRRATADLLHVDPPTEEMKRVASCVPGISIEKTQPAGLLDRDVLGKVEREGGLAHRRTAGDDDHVGRLQAGGLLVEVDQAGRHAGDLGGLSRS